MLQCEWISVLHLMLYTLEGGILRFKNQGSLLTDFERGKPSAGLQGEKLYWIPWTK